MQYKFNIYYYYYYYYYYYIRLCKHRKRFLQLINGSANHKCVAGRWAYNCGEGGSGRLKMAGSINSSLQ